MDRRVQRTRNSLIEAMPKLMMQYDWDEINVQRLCDQADVSRSTFYTHFRNKAEVLDQCFVRLEQELLTPIASRGIDSQGTLAFVPNLLNHIQSHCQILRRNSKSSAGLIILNRFKSQVLLLAQREFKQCQQYRLNKDQVTFITGGIFAIIEQWNHEHCQTPVKTLTKRIDSLVIEFLTDTD